MFVQALVLDAAMTAAESLERLGLYGAEERVVIRRVHQRRLFFYLFTVADLREKLGRADSSLALEAALELGRARSPARTLGPDQPVGRMDAVLLDEDEMVLGVWIAPPPGMRDGHLPVVTRPRDGNMRGVHDPRATRQVGAFPVLDAPEAVAPRERFELVIGLSALRQAGVNGDVVLEVPAEETAADLDVQVIADGFDAPEGLRRILHVVYDDLDRTRVTVPLVAREVDRARTSLLIVHFSRDGAVCGTASRRIVVEPQRPHAAAAPGRGAAPPVRRPPAVSVRASTGASINLRPEDVPDLTLTLRKPDDAPSSGRYTWTVTSPYIECSPPPLTMDLGSDSGTFVRRMLGSVGATLATSLQDGTIRGFAMDIADQVPCEVFDAVRAVATQVAAEGRAARVLLLTDEPNIPWELAHVDPPLPPAGADAPPYLGAQVAIARWPAGLPLPPEEVEVRRMAVVRGMYEAGNDLPMADREVATLVSIGATEVLPSAQDVRRMLDGDLPEGGVQAIHVIAHGAVDDCGGSVIDLGGDTVLHPHLFRSARVGRSGRPFLFLNACEVGNAAAFLGAYAGFAGFAIRGGFSGVVAPVWAVDDTVALRITREFYEEAFGNTPVADVLRNVRSSVRPTWRGITSATPLAYIFYGTPGMMLKRLREGEPVAP
ncbi:MAG: CHAT domain-containing protein, partial [Gemmatimonadetes bacterium]|nr:CHAT domain-containing protein [Gemmatimonadota bacterium]